VTPFILIGGQDFWNPKWYPRIQEHVTPFILIGGQDFGTQNGTQESKNMLLLLS
jgi:hypothetical protein